MTVVRSWIANHEFAGELARRPELQYTVAGLDKSREVGRHPVWATGPLRRRNLRRRLDDAAVKIATKRRSSAVGADHPRGGGARVVTAPTGGA